jgi:hypothetical protein
VVPHLAHGGGDGWNSSDMTRRLPDFQAGAQTGLSATGAWRAGSTLSVIFGYKHHYAGL